MPRAEQTIWRIAAGGGASLYWHLQQAGMTGDHIDSGSNNAEARHRTGTIPAGYARLTFKRDGAATRLDDLYQRTPLRVLFPGALPGDPITAALTNTSGGLVGGDRMAIEIGVGDGAAALVCAQAAEKVYRSLGEDSHIDLDLRVGQDGWLEMLPQETILFDGARLRRRCAVGLDHGSGFLGGEILVLGRLARGEQMQRGLLQDGWEIRRNNTLVWTDRLRLDGEITATAAHPAALGGAAAFASLIFAAPEAGACLGPIRERLAAFPERASATVVNGILVIRWLSRDPLALRRAFAESWVFLRAEKKLPPSLPRLWHI